MDIRTTEIIQAMADILSDDGYIDGNFIRVNNVSASELEVFNIAGDILRGFLRLPERKQVTLIISGSGVPDEITDKIEQIFDDVDLKKKLGIRSNG